MKASTPGLSGDFSAEQPALLWDEGLTDEQREAAQSSGKAHRLLAGPGTGKTLMTRSFAQSIGGQFKRVQLTPDLLPSDATGFNLYRPDGRSEFIPGPLFANVVLADELNRATARTQSAFLEAMEERQVTIEGTTHPLPRPFMVVASQAPSLTLPS